MLGDCTDIPENLAKPTLTSTARDGFMLDFYTVTVAVVPPAVELGVNVSVPFASMAG